ncbi:MAG TPA: hypothetical protein VF613_12705 [Longimicrobium sp.]|jgi:hypothetical protein
MPTKEKNSTIMAVQYRAVCDRGDYKGKWQTSEEAAAGDANRHAERPGKGDHVIRIVMRQTSSFVFSK